LSVEQFLSIGYSKRKIRRIKLNRKLKKTLLFGILSIVTLGMFTQCQHPLQRDFSEKMLKHMDRMVGKLDLDADQESKYQAIRTKISADLKLAYQSRISGIKKVKAEFSKETPDVKALSTSVKIELNERNALMLKAPDYFNEFYGILKPEQKKKVNEWISDKLDNFSPEEK
jgi:Spy/CpxP family protein refolding chaperone